MTADRTVGWRWSNVPVPEPHLAGLIVGMILHALKPVRFVGNRRLARGVGLGSIGVGLGVIGWAVRTIGDSDVETPPTLVTSGPYAHNRNPMYVGWTALYLGIGLVTNNGWQFAGLPIVLIACDRTVRREERLLEEKFGKEYRSYRREVPRYGKMMAPRGLLSGGESFR